MTLDPRFLEAVTLIQQRLHAAKIRCGLAVASKDDRLVFTAILGVGVLGEGRNVNVAMELAAFNEASDLREVADLVVMEIQSALAGDRS